MRGIVFEGYFERYGRYPQLLFPCNCLYTSSTEKLSQVLRMRDYSQIVVGGGAAGFFGAIACAEAHPHARVLLLEASHQPLAKVRISGGVAMSPMLVLIQLY